MLRGISEPETVLASKSTNSRKQRPREMLTGTSSSLPMSMRPIFGDNQAHPMAGNCPHKRYHNILMISDSGSGQRPIASDINTKAHGASSRIRNKPFLRISLT